MTSVGCAPAGSGRNSKASEQIPSMPKKRKTFIIIRNLGRTGIKVLSKIRIYSAIRDKSDTIHTITRYKNRSEKKYFYIVGIFLIFQNKSPLEAKPKPTKRDTARYIPVFHSGPRQKNYRAPGRRQLSAQLFDKIIIMYCIILILLYIYLQCKLPLQPTESPSVQTGIPEPTPFIRLRSNLEPTNFFRRHGKPD